MPSKPSSMVLGLVGAAVGAVLGFFAFVWFIRHGFYALVLPGAAMGLFCGLLGGRGSLLRGIVCGIGALLFGLWCEWKEFPFQADDSLTYFLQHLHELNAVTILMICLGAILAFWGGREEIGNLWSRPWTKPRAPRDGGGSAGA